MNQSSKFRLKAGVDFWRSRLDGNIRIGSKSKNYLLPERIGELEVWPALERLRAGADLSQVAGRLISILKPLSLIDSEWKELSHIWRNNFDADPPKRATNSLAEENSLTRLRIEAEAITRRPKIADGGIGSLLNRRDFQIEIFGAGRILTPLLGALFSSGFQNLTLTDDSRVTTQELVGGYLGLADVGNTFGSVLKNLKSSTAIRIDGCEELPTQGVKPDLLITLKRPGADLIMEWNRRGIPQLNLEVISSGELRIGPFLTPPKGACYNCIFIAEEEQGLGVSNSKMSKNKNLRIYEAGKEVGATLALLGSSLLALEVAQIADTGSSGLHQRSLDYSMLQFLEPQITSWERNPRCGCNWS